MKRIISSTLALLIVMSAMTGCTAVGVPYTTNPDKKLRYAESLFSNEDRPLPAQSLILEAIDKYKSNRDDVGLANAIGATSRYNLYIADPIGAAQGLNPFKIGIYGGLGSATLGFFHFRDRYPTGFVQ